MCGFVIVLMTAVTIPLCVYQEEQAAKLKAERIRVALEKIKEAQVKKVGPASRPSGAHTDSSLLKAHADFSAIADLSCSQLTALPL